MTDQFEASGTWTCQTTTPQSTLRWPSRYGTVLTVWYQQSAQSGTFQVSDGSDGAVGDVATAGPDGTAGWSCTFPDAGPRDILITVTDPGVDGVSIAGIQLAP